MVKQVIPFAGQFIDAVYVDRIERMFFIYRQILRPAIKLAVASSKRTRGPKRIVTLFMDSITLQV